MIFFASQCTLISNNSVLPSRKYFKTDKRLYKLTIKEDNILKIIRKLNVNKAHDHDDISIRMLKICDSVLTEPLSIIFNNCIDRGVFPDTWKMSHIIPIHKTNDKRSLNNYCPVSLFVEKYLKEPYLMIFLHSLKIITYLLLNNLVLGQMILVSVSFYQLFIVFNHIKYICSYKILDWAFKWKMLFNPDITKQAKEVIFSCKIQKQITPQSFLMKYLLLIPLVKSILECI